MRRNLQARIRRRVQISHAATIGIRKPWLYSSWTDQRLTNSLSALWKAIAAKTTPIHPQIHPRTRTAFGRSMD